MFNRGRYNHMRYNVASQQEVDLRDSLLANANVRCLVSRGGNVYDVVFSNAVIHAENQLSASIRDRTPYVVAVSAHASASADLNAKALAEAVLHSGAYMSSDYHAALLSGAEMAGDLWMSTDALDALLAEAEISQAAYMGTDMQEAPLLASAAILAQVATQSFEITEAEISVVIPPGGVLIIDSNDYFVMLNNENVIHTHSGEWVVIDRNLFDVTIMPMSGTMDDASVRILYTERWL